MWYSNHFRKKTKNMLPHLGAVPSMLAKPAEIRSINRNSEHQTKDSPVGQNLVECCTTAHIEWEILDACRGVEKLMTIEAIYIKKM